MKAKTKRKLTLIATTTAGTALGLGYMLPRVNNPAITSEVGFWTIASIVALCTAMTTVAGLGTGMILKGVFWDEEYEQRARQKQDAKTVTC